MSYLQQCMNCGHGGYYSHELKEGLCPGCQQDDDEDIYYCDSCQAMFGEECCCDELNEDE